jgi:hypothetical protein
MEGDCIENNPIDKLMLFIHHHTNLTTDIPNNSSRVKVHSSSISLKDQCIISPTSPTKKEDIMMLNQLFIVIPPN